MRNLIIALGLAALLAGLACDVSEGQSRSRRGNTRPDPIPEQNAPSPPPSQQTSAKPQTAVGFFGRDGGQLSLIAKDGTRYLLEIPKGALIWGSRIEMAALDRVPGLPDFLKDAKGVWFSPSGLEFGRDAWLTITPANQAPAHTVTFAHSMNRLDGPFSPEPHKTDGTSLRVPIRHFSGFWTSTVENNWADRYLDLLDEQAVRMANLPTRTSLELERIIQLLGIQGGLSDEGAAWMLKLGETKHRVQQLKETSQRAADQNNLRRLRFMREVDERVLEPRYLATKRPGATCREMASLLRLALSLERQVELIGVPVVMATASAVIRDIDFLSRGLKICKNEALRECWVSGNAGIGTTFIFATERQRQLLGLDDGTNTTMQEVMEAFKTLIPCKRYQVKISVKQQNKNLGGRAGFWHDIRVDDEINTVLEAKAAELLDDEGRLVLDKHGNPHPTIAIRAEAEHWPLNYVYDYKATRAGCNPKNTALLAKPGDRMVIELDVIEDDALIRIRPGSIELHFRHSTCSIEKFDTHFEDLWTRSFLEANNALRDGNKVLFFMPRTAEYPRIGFRIFEGKGTVTKASPENEDMEASQTTVIEIIHKPNGTPPPEIEPVIRKPLPVVPSKEKPVPL